MFSGLSSFIYYPAIRPLAHELHVSVAAINLTVSAYLIVAGIFPSIIGDIGDHSGRRLASLLAFTLYFAANIGLDTQHSYAALVVLRCIQSAGSAGAIAIAYGVIADITTPAERGSYGLSWRWIFWFLAILSGTNLLGLVLFFPETSRKLVGNGSIPPPSILHKSVYPIFANRKSNAKPTDSNGGSFKHFPNPLTCLTTLFHKATFIIIAVGSIQYAIFSALGTSLTTQMATRLSVNYLTAGLIYLPAGIGGLLAAFFTGRLVDYDYQVTKRSFPSSTPSQPPSTEDVTTRNINPDSPNDLLAFPIEKARLRSIFPFLAIASISTVGYGWSLQANAHIAVPLVLQFLSGSSQSAIFVICGTLLTDFNPRRSATAQASYNLVRCALAAGGVAALEPLAGGVGVGWCFTVYTTVGVLCVPLLIVLRALGWGWRREKARREGSVV
ncbi:hypothetical protein AJ79_01164 [Helicocarpus griseus UAMH5409]|uniref:Major facilitator superfamily (MFS) profile domain-containing protein n=1 Tax=Helicocarpus griseus UAMH5409 TaxID=1447875 RepID=A0A2B7Y899_9EURO|nr:hypothetical protein AJ79_01164 [Helicocarpus griseus UAMH5409]